MNGAKKKFKEAVFYRNYAEALSMFHDYGDESYVQHLLEVIDRLEDQKMCAQGDLLRVIDDLKNKLEEYEPQDSQDLLSAGKSFHEAVKNMFFSDVVDSIKALEEPLHSAFEKAMADPELNPGAIAQEDCVVDLGSELFPMHPELNNFKFDMPEGFRYTGEVTEFISYSIPPKPIKGSKYVNTNDGCVYEFDGDETWSKCP